MATKHPRNIVRHQFANGCTVDGSRLDAAMQDIQTRWNNVQGKDIKTRWMPTQFVAGWSPPDKADARSNEYHRWPWQPAQTVAAELQSGTVEDITNEYRAKGWKGPTSHGISDPFHWENAYYFREPVIITHFAMYLVTDESGLSDPVYDNRFDDSDDNISVCISVDSEFDRTDRTTPDMVWNWNDRVAEYNLLSESAWTGSYTDMTPSHPGGDLNGLSLEADLVIPIPERSRVRVIVTIPGEVANNNDFVYDVQWNTCLTVLEPIHA